MTCIFCKIANKEVAKDFIYEDADIMVFPDIHPVKQTHILIVPKMHITDFQELTDDNLLAKIRKVIQQMAKKHQLTTTGYRVLINAGGAQAVDHLHFHLMGPMGHAAQI